MPLLDLDPLDMRTMGFGVTRDSNNPPIRGHEPQIELILPQFPGSKEKEAIPSSRITPSLPGTVL